MQNVVYKYIKIDTNEVVYVGRTNNLQRRRDEHERYEPFEPGRPHYDYPLSRAIRKYGLSNFKCEIIEDNLTYEDSLKREQYWIAYYDTYNDPAKYNYTPGGEYITDPVYSEEVIDRVKFLLEQKISFSEIQKETGISLPHISEINTGKRRKDNIHTYPINSMTCGRKLTQTQVKEIIELLQQGTLNNLQISIKYEVSDTVIERINKGISYKQPEIEYPIRKRLNQNKHHRLTQTQFDNLATDLIESTLSFKELAIKYDISIATIYNINSGRTRKQNKYNYPLRKDYK